MSRIIATPAARTHHHTLNNSNPKDEDAESATVAAAVAAAAGEQNQLQILWNHQVLDPDSDIVAHWNHVFLVICIAALFIGPLYLYLPFGGPACLSIDRGLAVFVTFFRTVTDL